MTPLAEFSATLRRPDLIDDLRAGLIGDDAVVDGPFGPKPMIYADYVASGRALWQVERFILERVLPYYANTHTQASFCGSFSTRLREEARSEIARIVGAPEGHSVIFTGSGSTGGLNRIVGLLDIAELARAGERVVVLVGPYEHHSNLLPWRESGAEMHEIPEGANGGPDLAVLEAVLADAKDAALVVGSFSAASNVTGIVTDVDAVTRILKQYGAVSVWDYGGGGPYLPMTMNAGTDTAKDAIVFSSHKFPGGPGASGVTVIRDAIARRKTPTLPGGGTVSFVSPWMHVYSDSLADREEGGTPNVVGDIRAALVLLIKEAMGADWLASRQQALRQRALAAWADNPRIDLLGNPDAPHVLPIFSFRIRDAAGALVHHQLFTRLLSDVHGVQARGGCACAGSYAHHLLGIDADQSDAILTALDAGVEIDKPGWVRLNLSVLMSDAKVDAIIAAVTDLAETAPRHAERYLADLSNARFRPESATEVA
ncbi:aminotransferase class V-fold PLP-dependent enzyme [Pseudoruegeria sp. SK021]|uniref:aminotransferase class V-fold PLP-dependent enzyme n=1 Tax=Pseudoruegeria sp. SK021 TaxID=1933035 RepID=UPI000A21CC65|nr:aminotransferase class V-fold PLP-dependent enzyme [Pseudoruegeria sp. SK021]OSP54196.1 aminotransferase class V [Pseudoruegeria sp. SK021]